jgi:hypothetical protein
MGFNDGYKDSTACRELSGSEKKTHLVSISFSISDNAWDMADDSVNEGLIRYMLDVFQMKINSFQRPYHLKNTDFRPVKTEFIISVPLHFPLGPLKRILAEIWQHCNHL